MSGTTGSPPADSSGSTDPQASQTQSDGTVGYTTPEEQQTIDQQNQQADDRGLNQNLAHQFQQRAAQEQAAQAAVAGGGFELDLDAMNTFHPRWQALADKLETARRLGEQFLQLTAPAEDDGSGLVGKAAQEHAAAYQQICTAQRAAAQKYADDLKSAIDAYGKQDQTAADAAAKHGRQM
jgi:hypothetical protein